jgi:uncharacterized membrane protein
MNPLFIGGALGALAMYFLDSHSGRRRRARTRDRLAHVARQLNDAGKVTVRDTAHRAYGLVANTRRLFQREDVSDEVLVERVRAALGRFVSHPHAIDVSANCGHVRLDGPILAREVRPLIRAVRHVAGVRGLDDRLTVFSDAEHVSSLQGGVPRGGRRFELLQENWSPATRLATGALGAGMMLCAARSSTMLGTLLGLAGGGLLARSATNKDIGSLLGFTDLEHGIAVQKTINVDAPPEVVFAFWTDYQNFPRFMHNVREVRELAEGRSRWVVAGPAGVPVKWTAEVTRNVPDCIIDWRASGSSDVLHKGQVRFESNGDDGTRVTVRLSYLPPGGAFGHAVAAVFGADPKSEMDGDLMRMKTMIETGRPPHDAAKRIGSPRES